MQEIDTPIFTSEREEAEWWDSHPDEIYAAFEQAAKDGTLNRGTTARRMGITPTTTIRLDPADVELAKVQAEARGLKYQTYLKMIIHQELVKEAAERSA